jgi:hypothetical protein
MKFSACLLVGVLLAAVLLFGCLGQNSKQANFNGGGGCEKRGSMVGGCYILCNGTITNSGDAPGSGRVSFDILEDNGWRKSYNLGPYLLQPNQTQYWNATHTNADCNRRYDIDSIRVWGVN